MRKRPLRDRPSASVGAGSWDKIRGEADLSVPLTENGKIRSRVVAAYSQGNSNVTFLDARSRTFYGVVSADLTPDTVLTASVEYQRNISTVSAAASPVLQRRLAHRLQPLGRQQYALGATGHGIHHLFRRPDPPLRQ